MVYCMWLLQRGLLSCLTKQDSILRKNWEWDQNTAGERQKGNSTRKPRKKAAFGNQARNSQKARHHIIVMLIDKSYRLLGNLQNYPGSLTDKL